MTFLDRYLQRRRIKKAIRYIPEKSVVLDIGCHHGELFALLGKKLGYGVGIDPVLETDVSHEKYILLKDIFPSPRGLDKIYHCVVMLAVFEHLKPDEQRVIISACHKLLHTEGLTILTVPDKRVDNILFILQKLRLIKGMQLQQHYGFDISQLPSLFTTAGFELVVHRKFQFGLNNLFVFRKSLP